MRRVRILANSATRKAHLIEKRIAMAASHCLFGALELFSQFLANDRQLRRCFDADANTAVTDFDHGHGNLISDKNSFANFST